MQDGGPHRGGVGGSEVGTIEGRLGWGGEVLDWCVGIPLCLMGRNLHVQRCRNRCLGHGCKLPRAVEFQVRKPALFAVRTVTLPGDEVPTENLLPVVELERRVHVRGEGGEGGDRGDDGRDGEQGVVVLDSHSGRRVWRREGDGPGRQVMRQGKVRCGNLEWVMLQVSRDHTREWMLEVVHPFQL